MSNLPLRLLNKRRRSIKPSNHRAGAATIEYAVIIAVVAAVLIVSVEGLGLSVSSSLSGVNVGLAEAPSPTNGKPLRIEAGSTVGELQQAFDFPRAAFCVQTGILVLCFAYLVLDRRRRRREAQLKHELPADGTSTHPSLIWKRQAILRSLTGDLESFVFDRVAVRHIMTSSLVKAERTASVEQLKELMHRRELRHLLIVDEDDRLVGIVSDRDLRGCGKRTAEAIMSPPRFTCLPDTPLRHAITILLESHISALPVLDDGVLVGIVTLTDMAMTLQCSLQLVQRAVADLIGAAGFDDSAQPNRRRHGDLNVVEHDLTPVGSIA